MGSVAENLRGQTGEHIAWPNLDENARAGAIHGFDLVGKPNGTDQVIGQYGSDGIRIVRVGSRGGV
jgi:hypothetical protein